MLICYSNNKVKISLPRTFWGGSYLSKPYKGAIRLITRTKPEFRVQRSGRLFPGTLSQTIVALVGCRCFTLTLSSLTEGREAHHHTQGEEGDERDVHQHDRE